MQETALFHKMISARLEIVIARQKGVLQWSMLSSARHKNRYDETWYWCQNEKPCAAAVFVVISGRDRCKCER